MQLGISNDRAVSSLGRSCAGGKEEEAAAWLGHRRLRQVYIVPEKWEGARKARGFTNSGRIYQRRESKQGRRKGRKGEARKKTTLSGGVARSNERERHMTTKIAAPTGGAHASERGGEESERAREPREGVGADMRARGVSGRGES